MDDSEHYRARADLEKAFDEAGGRRGYVAGEGVDQIVTRHLHAGQLARKGRNSSSAVI